MSDEKVPAPIEFGKRREIDPDDEKAYREKIERAKKPGGLAALKERDPVGGAPKPQNLPLLQKNAPQTVSGLQDGGVQPRPAGSPLLSPETQQQLEAVQKAQSGQPALDEQEVKKQAQAAQEEEVFDSVFDWAGRDESERTLNNKKRRAAIESRCSPMKLEDLIMRDEVQQVIPIVPDQFWVKLRSYSPAESLFIKQVIAKEQKKEDNDQYLIEKYSLCQITCALLSLNGKDFPDHRNSNGEPTEELFKIKLKMVMKKSVYVVADLMLNYAWFDIRVRKLLAPDDIKNG